jgi:hypothetical protein
VTSWLEDAERAGEHLGELGQAWFRAGQSLCRQQTTSARALTLLAALGGEADAQARDTLAGIAEPEPWKVARTHTRDDTVRGWPGPVAALSSGLARHTGALLVADHLGDVRVLDKSDGTVRGRLTTSERRPVKAVFCLPEGTVAVLDEWGCVRLAGESSQPAATGLQALIDPDADPWQALRDAVLTFPDAVDRGARLTAAAPVPGGVAFGDDQGRVHVLTKDNARNGPLTQTLHQGPVVALAGLALGGDDGVPLLYSGGVDGRVRMWGPGAEPLSAAVRERPLSVVALSASAGGREGAGALAVAWADGLVEYETLESGTATRPSRAGPVLSERRGPHDEPDDRYG